jgi:protein arginine kinase activator
VVNWRSGDLLCDHCGKKKATVHYTEVVGGKVTDLHLCGQCADQKGLANPLSKTKFSVADFLAGLAEGLDEEELEKETQVRCPACGLSYAEFRRLGKLGCGECYSSFAPRLDPLLRRIHGSTRHCGKAVLMTGERAETRRELAELQKKLDAAIHDEEFEEAARLRDKMRDIHGAMFGQETEDAGTED